MSENKPTIGKVIQDDGSHRLTKEFHDITYALDQSAIVAITDQIGRIVYVNELFTEISQYAEEELLGETHRLINSGKHPKIFFKEMWATIGRGDIWRGDVCNRAKDGSLYWVNTTIVPFLNENGKPYQYISIRSDITLQKQMKDEIKQSTEIYRLITENASDFISIVDREGNYQYVSPSYEKLLGYDLTERMTSNIYSIVIEEDQEVLQETIKSTGLIQSSTALVEFRIQTPDRDVIYMEATINLVLEPGTYYGNLVFVMRDITTRKESERMIRNLAYNDQLTNLLNRTAFRKQLYEDIESARKMGSKLAFVYLNIDRLRYINDALGHEVGDYMLSVVGKRLKETLSYDDTIGRLGGDEFAFVLKNLDDAESAETITGEIQSYLEEPIVVAGESYILSTSCGIALFPEHAKKPSELVSKAEKALYNTKAHGGGGYEVYQPGTATRSLERILLENEMRKSIKLGHFSLDYQPKVKLASGKLSGVEALVRWNHPDLGRIPPNEFIPMAEETRIIVALGEWVLREACNQAKRWKDKGYEPFRIAVNMSAIQLEEPNIVETIEKIIGETAISPDLIEIELTESAFADRDEMQGTIQKIRNLGITVSIDDFGTGYSTFSYIRELPVDTVKIDMSFIRDIHINEESRAIVKAILSLADTVGLNVIAEGVEYKEQVEILQAFGCQEAQGYFYSKPCAPKDCEPFMKKVEG